MRKVTKRWRLLSKSADTIIDQLLINRGITNQSKRQYLTPDFAKDFLNPLQMLNMELACRRILQAKKEKEPIGIFADYDADGVTSATLLGEILQKLDISYEVYIPLRDEGYGLSEKGIQYLADKGVNLLISVDMGVTGKKEISYATKKGLDAIVIDHHLLQDEKLPDCLIVNPHQPNDPYPFKEFSACGLVFKLAQAIHLLEPTYITEADYKWWIDLAAISTVADMVPLQGENRIIVQFGLKVLRQTNSIGLRALCEAGSIDIAGITTGTIAFQIAPRLNAPGRIGNANIAHALLAEKNKETASKIATQIQEINTKRQTDLLKILAEAKEKVIKNKYNDDYVILVSSSKWVVGLVGLVAGRLLEEYYRPVVVAVQGNGIARGSARSIEQVHILELFENVKDKLISFGGHARAGGLSYKIDDESTIREALNKFVSKKIAKADMVPELIIDCKVNQEEITMELLSQIEQLQPFGFENRKPLFLIENQKIVDVQVIGKDKNHIKIRLQNNRGIFFNGTTHEYGPAVGDVADIVFSPYINEWNGNKYIELSIEDWKRSK